MILKHHQGFLIFYQRCELLESWNVGFCSLSFRSDSEQGPGKCGVEWICLDVYRDAERVWLASGTRVFYFFICLFEKESCVYTRLAETLLLQPLGAGITHMYSRYRVLWNWYINSYVKEYIYGKLKYIADHVVQALVVPSTCQICFILKAFISLVW